MNILEFESFAWYIPFLGPRFFSALFIASESASAQFFFWHLFLFQVLRGLDILKLVNVLRGLDILKQPQSSSFSFMSFTTATASHFLSLDLAFSVIINIKVS